MKKNLKQILILICLVIFSTLPFLVFAADPLPIKDTGAMGRLQAVGTGAYAVANETTLSSILGRVVKTVLSMLGIVFVILIVRSGYQWMNAGGNEKEVDEAQARLRNAIIGLVITISAYAIFSFVFSYFIMARPV